MNALVVRHLEVQQKSRSHEHREQDSHSKAYVRDQYVPRSALITRDRAKLYDSCWDSCVLQGCSFPCGSPRTCQCPLLVLVFLQFVLIC